MPENTYLITGAMGCIGAWTTYHLVQMGKRAVSFDLSEDRSRVSLLMTPEEQERVTFVKGDLTDSQQVLDVFCNHQITHVIHLAALQVPFCRANPVQGAQVNVVGTVNVFEAARQVGIKHLAYASSIAVYGPPDDYPPGPIAPDAQPNPRTLYGVYKVCNEGTARIYWLDHQISSTTLRPYTVYGVARDQGLTSEPSKAMLAAAAGQNYHISFGGKMLFHLASDVALQFIEAAETPLNGAFGFNLGTPPREVHEVAKLIMKAKPGVTISHDDNELPFPEAADDTVYKRHLNQIVETPLENGIEQTIVHFERLLKEGRISLP